MRKKDLEFGRQSPQEDSYNRKKFRRLFPDEIRWDDARVCRFHLVGFCPDDLLANADSDLSDGCPSIHDESLNGEFSRRESYAPLFEAELGLCCSLLVSKPGNRCKCALENFFVPPPALENNKWLERDGAARMLMQKVGLRDGEEQTGLTAQELYESILRFCEPCDRHFARDGAADKSHFSSKQHEVFKGILGFLKNYKERRRKMGRGEDMIPDVERMQSLRKSS